jgi:hypothetical protein
MKTRKKPHPKKESMWVNELSETRYDKYLSKFKEKHGETSEPLIVDFDPKVAMLAGEGLKNGRLWIGDGCVDPMTIPSLR